MVIHARRIKEEGREDMQTIRDHFRTCLLHQCGVVHERCGFTKEGREVGWIHWLGSMHAWWRNLSCCWCSRKVMVSGHACGCIHEVLIHQGLGSRKTCSCFSYGQGLRASMWLHTRIADSIARTRDSVSGQTQRQIPKKPLVIGNGRVLEKPQQVNKRAFFGEDSRNTVCMYVCM